MGDVALLGEPVCDYGTCKSAVGVAIRSDQNDGPFV